MNTVIMLGVRVAFSAEWSNTSEEAGNADRLLTLTKPDGVGSLQMSFAQYLSGESPDIKHSDLQDLLRDFAADQDLGYGRSLLTGGYSGTFWCRADYHHEGNFIRVWYISDGQSVCLVTYICLWNNIGLEVVEASKIAEAIVFCNSDV